MAGTSPRLRIGERGLIGTCIGNFRIVEVLGEGGMGRVYRAAHTRIEREMAVKVLAASITGMHDVERRFEAEALMISRIHHPNVVEVYDYGSLDDGKLYYAMELLPGPTLADYLERCDRLSMREAAPLVVQICGALQAAHELGVVHRDLKPENILVQDPESLSIKIVDFGIAKLLDGETAPNLTRTGTVMGTPLLISPEQAAGEVDRVGPRSDLYSFGGLLYRLLAGRYPFMDKSANVLVAMHLYDRPAPLETLVPGLPRAVTDLVQRCLEKDPAKRPSSAKVVARIYEEALADLAPGEDPGSRDREEGSGEGRQDALPAGEEHDMEDAGSAALKAEAEACTMATPEAIESTVAYPEAKADLPPTVSGASAVLASAGVEGGSGAGQESTPDASSGRAPAAGSRKRAATTAVAAGVAVALATVLYLGWTGGSSPHGNRHEAPRHRAAVPTAPAAPRASTPTVSPPRSGAAGVRSDVVPAHGLPASSADAGPKPRGEATAAQHEEPTDEEPAGDPTTRRPGHGGQGERNADRRKLRRARPPAPADKASPKEPSPGRAFPEPSPAKAVTRPPAKSPATNRDVLDFHL